LAGSWDPSPVSARAEPRDTGYVLSGEKTHVIAGSVANLVIAPFSIGGEIALFAIDLSLPGVTAIAERSIDPSRPTARLVFENAPIDRASRLDRSEYASLAWLHQVGWTLSAAELLGSAEAVLGTTRDYALERIQFDRPIGAFQAVKHPLVDVMISVEMARSLVVGAAAAVHAGSPDAERAARMAKAATTDALLFACDRGIQLHGGFGFTWDCDVHFYYKRALWGAATLGDGRHHRHHLARALEERSRG
jgi:alkylation response protein AidB-like acyl-CoA dehydrogenase